MKTVLILLLLLVSSASAKFISINPENPAAFVPEDDTPDRSDLYDLDIKGSWHLKSNWREIVNKGSSARSPIQVNSQAEYDKLLDGTWVRNANGDVWQKGSPVPTVVTEEDYNAVPLGASYRQNGWLHIKGTAPWQTPTPVSDTPIDNPTPNPTPVVSLPDFYRWETLVVLAIIGVIFGGICLVVCARNLKPKPKYRPDPAPKRSGQVYYDQAQFQMAMRIWERDRQLFEEHETQRLAQLNERLKEYQGPISVLGLVVLIAVTWAVWSVYGGWQIILVDLVIFGVIVSAEQTLNRWRHRALLVRQEFGESQPVYQQRAQEPPPPPKQEPPRTEYRQAPPPVQTEPARITSMRQAYEVLGLPPGRTSLETVRDTYRKLIAEYHPDKVAHLGKELRDLAARKALEINLAMQFVEENAKSGPSGDWTSGTHKSKYYYEGDK